MTLPSSQTAPRRFGAFSYAPYRRFWLAALFRVFGLQFRFIGVGWLVVSEEGLDLSPIWLGIVGLSAALPTIAFSVPAGIIADRYEHRGILAGGQGLTSALSLLLAIGILQDLVNVWLLIAWAVTVGCLTAVSMPAQSAILPRLIEPASMPSAVALISSIWNTMRILGPAAAGVLIAWIGIGQAFFVTAVGFALSALLIATLRLDPLERGATETYGGVLDGVRYIFRDRLFFATIGLSFFTSIFGMAYQTLLPVFAKDVLVVGSTGFGLLETAVGVGGFLGTLTMIKVGGRPSSGIVMLAAAAVFGLFIAGFAASRDFERAAALLFCAGFFSSLYLNIGMTTLQVLVPDELRGRVMGVWSMTWFLSAVGGLPASALAEWIGAPWTVALGALSVTGFAALVFLLSKELRRLPAIESGRPVRGAAPVG
jgi:MFS family permease